MVQIPENEVTQADLERWFVVKKQLNSIKTEEMFLRLKIYKGKFVTHDADGNEILPKEGTNAVDLADGFKLKAQRVVNREVDKATLEVMKEDFRKSGINPDLLIEYKPSLKVREYRTLTEEQRKLFDQALIIKDGSPQLEIVLPKRQTKD